MPILVGQEAHYAGEVSFADMHAGLPYVSQPRITVSDFLTSQSPLARVDSGEITYDSDVGAAHPSEVFVPSNQRITDAITIKDDDVHLNGDLPDVEWDTFSVTGDAHVQMFRDRSGYGYQIIDVRSSDPSTAGSLQLEAATALGPTWQGFMFVFNRAMFTWHTAAGDPYVNLYFHVSSETALGHRYGIQITPQKRVRIVYSTDEGVSYRPLEATVENGPSYTSMAGNQSRLRGTEFQAVEVKVMAGRLIIRIHGTTTAFSIPVTVPKEDENDPNPAEVMDNPYINQVELRCKAFTHISFALHPKFFLAYSSYRSAPQQLGTVADASTPPHYTVHTNNEVFSLTSGGSGSPSYPATSSVTVTTVAGTEASTAPVYDLEIDNGTPEGTYQGQDYTSTTAVVSRVTTRIDEIVEISPYAPVTLPLEIGTPKAPFYIRESIQFQPDRLTIDHTIELHWNNRQGIDEFAFLTGVLASGNVAVNVKMGWQHMPELIQIFRGFVHTYEFDEGPNSYRVLKMYASDQMMQIGDSFVAAPPNVDGYNHYAAVAEWLMFAGIPLEQMAFRDLVPDDPFTASPDDPDPYYLPVGIGFRPITPINRTLSVTDLLDPIRKYTGNMVYIDSDGLVQYRPWIPPLTEAPKKVFTMYANEDLTEMFSMRATSSTLSVRNVVALIGLDQYRTDENLIIETRRDDLSISSPIPQPKNFVGYKKPMILTDSRFANGPFASDSADRLYNIMRQPEYTVDITSWAQPELFVMDTIIADDGCISNIRDIPFYVFGIVNTWAVGPSGVLQQSSMNGRFLDPEGLTMVGGI